LIDEWRARVQRLRDELGWPAGESVARVHGRDASLAITAPLDQLFTATEVNEWALLSALRLFPEAAFHAPGHPAAWDEESALFTLRAHSLGERNPKLMAFTEAAHARRLTVLIDDDSISAGVGDGARVWPSDDIPDPQQVDWNALHDTPIALVTGSNGKTTTTRLLAAMTRAHGWRTAYTCTDGVFVGTTARAAGDYSGPAGARVALRTPIVDMAILETARGGILRRGIAVSHANVAIVTNVSDDHFGEYGVHDLDDLAAAKLAVARTLGTRDVLVLNADDPLLARHGTSMSMPVHWFALDADAPLLVAQRAAGRTTCGMRAGRLFLQGANKDHDLGAIAAMPLSFNGSARYNIANIAATVLAADALGIAASTIAGVLTIFGTSRDDNPGRLQHWSFGGASVFVDYAHNPDGLRGLLHVATQVRGGRLGLLLGQAGNREDDEIRELAAAAAGFHPDRIVLKDIGGMLRGRIEGEVPALLREELAGHGIAGDVIVERLDEFEAVRELLAWARAGDVLVLPIHGTAIKPLVARLLDGMQRDAWMAGSAVPRV
jgi:cyanophycin synthetase